MEDKTRGYIEIIIGIIFFAAVLIVGAGIISIVGANFARVLSYYIFSAMVSSLIVGFLSGILISTGYSRTMNKESEEEDKKDD